MAGGLAAVDVQHLAGPLQPVQERGQFAGDREQRVICRLMGEVIAPAALDPGRAAARPQLGAGGSQRQVVQAGQGLLPLRVRCDLCSLAGWRPCVTVILRSA